MTRIGLIAGNGRLPFLFAEEAQKRGVSVVAVAHQGETDASLVDCVSSLTWVRVGQIQKITRVFRNAKVEKAVMAGGIGHVKALTDARPDWGALKVVAKLRSFRDDALLRAVADYFQSEGIEIVAPTGWLERVLAPEGHLGGPKLSTSQQADVSLGLEVANALGQADVGQTVVVKGGHVLALEALEGTDAAIRRGAQLGGTGAVVVKLCKPGQDERFDLPAVGPNTLQVMKEVGANVLAIETLRSILLDAPEMMSMAEQFGISVVAVSRRQKLG